MATTQGSFINNTEIKVGMVVSTMAEVISTRTTKTRIYYALKSAYDGHTYEDYAALSGKTFIVTNAGN